MLEQIKKKELKDALAKNTLDVTNEVTNKVTEEVTKEVKSDTTNKIAINMINMNMPIDDISKATGLSIENINKLKEELN